MSVRFCRAFFVGKGCPWKTVLLIFTIYLAMLWKAIQKNKYNQIIMSLWLSNMKNDNRGECIVQYNFFKSLQKFHAVLCYAKIVMERSTVL